MNGSAVAGPSDASRPDNPQMGLEPWFVYPKPSVEQLEEELPPYFESENVSLGLILDRLTLKGYGDLRRLLETTLPVSPLQHRPRLIIDFAKTQRQAFLKYVAILRWKVAVDVPVASSSSSILPSISFPTPQTNGSGGDSSNTSPAAGYSGKGKGKATDDDLSSELAVGKVTDAKRVTLLLDHQNRQSDEAIRHIAHVTAIVDSLRERNPDLLTSISLLRNGTYTRLPTSLTHSFKTPRPLTNRQLCRTLRRLNRHLLFRLKCVDLLPAQLVVEAVRDGKVYLGAGGDHGWKAQMTVVGFGEGDQARWWLTGVEWGWKVRQKGTDDPGGVRTLGEEERQQILDIVNGEILTPRSMEIDSDGKETVDAPLNRLYNFLEHLSLSYQLETLVGQAVELSQGRWRNHLVVDLDRATKTLTARYWIRPRPPAPPASVANKRMPSASLNPSRAPLVGGILRIRLSERESRTKLPQDLLKEALSDKAETCERILNLALSVHWEVGEAGAGGGLSAGNDMESSGLVINTAYISFSDILHSATRSHAAHLTRIHADPLISSPRIALFPLNPPSLVESDVDRKPLSLRIPLPSRQKESALSFSVSSLTGLIEIEDEGATDARAGRARMASTSINDSKTRLIDDLGRLITAVIADNLESQMRQLGWTPMRRLALRSEDLSRNDLHPATSIFVPLPTSPMHYFMAKLGSSGVTFELIKLARVPADKAIGMKLTVQDRTPLDMDKMKSRRIERAKANGGEDYLDAMEHLVTSSSFEVDNREVKELFVFCNALVAQTTVEQQLKDRSIPYSLQYPTPTGPGSATSTSAVAGMIPTLRVNVRDLLNDGRAANIAEPFVYIQIRDWWKGGRCSTVTAIQLQHKPALASTDPTGGPAEHEGISFDANTSVVRFFADDISRCVPSFLEQWERLSKVLVVAGEVNRLKKSGAFEELRMLSFDLRTVTFSYLPGYNASITYTPQDDSYEASFSAEDGENPHTLLAGLLSHHLNELTGGAPVASKKRTSGERFISLLVDTLPLLRDITAITSSPDPPSLVVRSVTDYRLVWDIQNARRHIVDLSVVGNRVLFFDGSTKSDMSCGPLTAVPGWRNTVIATFDMLKMSFSTLVGDRGPPAMVLDQGQTLMCLASEAGKAVTSLAEGVRRELKL